MYVSLIQSEICEKYNSIKFDQVRFDPKKLKKMANLILMVMVTTFYNNHFLIGEKSNLIKFDQVWTDLIQKNKRKWPFLSSW
jgi:hypothetical protein